MSLIATPVSRGTLGIINDAGRSGFRFDDVQGGAGHVRRLVLEGALRDVLDESLHRLELCDCGSDDGDASCYRCLRNYRHQFYHDDLKRGMVIEFLRRVLS